MDFKKIIISFFLVVFCLSISAQIFENDECAYHENEKNKPWVGNSEFLNNYLDSIEYFSYVQNFNNSLFRIPLTFWVYHDELGKLGANKSDIKKFMNEINYYYLINNTGISFYLAGINEIKKDKRRDLGYMIEAPFVSLVNKQKGTINIQISDALSVRRPLKPKSYYKGTYNKIIKGIIVTKTNSATGLSHEVGHYLGLKHPHENYDKGKLKQESVSRTRVKRIFFRKTLNCETNGDCLCDTPAEPRLSEHISNNCEFTGINLTDNWGDFYTPMTDNIMSYPTYKKCREKFTKQQIAVMLYTAEIDKHSEAWKTDSLNEECAQYKFDIYEPDDFQEMATIITEKEVQNHTFHKVYNGKDKPLIDSDTDWYVYNCAQDTLNSFNLTFNRGNVNFTKIDLQIFNSSNELIFEKKQITEDEKISIENIKNQTFYIKISKSESDENIIISDYLIILN